MNGFWSLAGWPVVVIGGAFFIYESIIEPKMAETARVLGKAETVSTASGFAKVWAIIDGWKTTILSLVAVGAQALALIPQYLDADLIKEWQALPWASVVDAKSANFITLACGFLIPITHTLGLNKAAKTIPQA